MITGVTHVSIFVENYDEALKWYTEKLGLEPRMDGAMGDDYRFVTVGVKGQDVEIVLHKPSGPKSASELIQDNMSVQPALVFGSDDCRKDTEELASRGVKIAQGDSCTRRARTHCHPRNIQNRAELSQSVFTVNNH